MQRELNTSTALSGMDVMRKEDRDCDGTLLPFLPRQQNSSLANLTTSRVLRRALGSRPLPMEHSALGIPDTYR